MFAPMVAVLPQLKAGRVRVLDATSSSRSAAVPELPALAESGLTGYEISSWFGLFVLFKTPADVVDRLYRETVKALQTTDVKERFAKYIKIVKDNNIKAD